MKRSKSTLRPGDSLSRAVRCHGEWALRWRTWLFATMATCLTFPGQSTSRAAGPDLVGPPGSGAFGTRVTVLPNGNYLVTDPEYDIPATSQSQLVANVGAVYLYHGVTLQLISVLTGSFPDDRVGSDGVVVLGNGN